MATAEELLAAEVGDLVAADVWFEVDLEDRVIRIPKGVTNLGVKSDADVKEVKFKLPRFYHDSDLYKFKIGVDYTNAEGEPDRYEPTDVKVDGEVLTFTWVVGRHAAIYNGNVTFNLCLKLTEGKKVIKEFHTTDAVLPILDTTETCEFAIVEYTDLLEQWREQLFGSVDSIQQQINDIESNVLQTIEEKGEQVLASLPADYTETHEMASQALRTRANAIVATAEGEPVVIADASDDYLRGMRIYGKSTQVKTTGAQILPLEDFQLEDRGLKVYVDGGEVRVVGTANYTSSFNITLYGTYSSTETVFTLPAGTYTITDCMIAQYDGTDRRMWGPGSTPTFNEDFDVTWVATRSYGAKESVDEVTYPMINSGSTALPWEPYTGGIAGPNPDYPLDIANVGADSNVVISVYGKNILEPKETTGSGYTTVLNDDGSITVTGAANTTDPIYLMFYSASLADSLKLSKNVKYHLWADTPNGLSIGTKMADDKGNAYWASVETWGKYAGTEYTNLLQIYIESKGHEIGDTSLCGTYRIQLEVGDKFTGFEKYKAPQTITIPAANGLPGIPVTSGGSYTDANGQQWICDEIDLARGVYVQRCAHYMFDGSEDEPWRGIYSHEGKPFVTIDVLRGSTQYTTPMLCNYALKNTWSAENVCFINNYDEYVIGGIPLASVLTDLDTFRQHIAVTPIEVVYILETPIETRLTDAEIFAFSKLHSNYPNTTVLNDSGAWMEVDYNADLTIYVHELVHRAVDNIVTDARIQVAVDNWLNAHYTSAEGVSF